MGDIAVVAALSVAGARLLWWRAEQMPHVGVAGWALFLVEVVTIVWMVVTAVLICGRTRSDAEAPAPDPATSLDVLIPVCGEPVEMVRRTIEAARAIRWPARVIVCNDGYLAQRENWLQIIELCDELGVECLTRDAGPRGKAGNLNAALDHCRGDVLLVLDADHQVVRSVAERMLGFFRHEEIGFVCTPQHFHGARSDPLNPTEPTFYGAIQPARDRLGLAFSTGNGVMYRREAVVRIGGFSEWSVVEDLHTSMRLHAAGWASAYHPRPVSIGLAPATAAEYARQRVRWALDSLRILRYDPPWRRAGLDWRARVHYGHTVLGYLAAMAQIGFLLGPPAWILGRMSVMDGGDLPDQVGYIGPWLAAVVIALVAWSGWRGALRSMRLTVALIPAIAWSAVAKVHRPRAERGTATNKASQPRINRVLLGASVLPAFLLATLVWGVFDPRPGGSDLAMVWAAILFSMAVGPLLRVGPRVRWSMVAQGSLVVAALAMAGGSVAVARFGWEPAAALYPSLRWDATSEVRVVENEVGGTVVLGPPVTAPAPPPAPRAAPEPPAPVRVSLEASDGIYVGYTSDALPYDLADLGRWAQAIGAPQIVHWYQQWGSGESRFRGDWLAAVDEAGAVPMVSWEAWAKPEGEFHSSVQELGELDRIVAGEHDAYLDGWAAAAADYGRPLLLRPFHEMNGFWYPWSVGENGNTADDFVAAWRHVVDRFDAAGADNVAFIWSINTLEQFEQGRGVEAYYPGDDYVDWVATSGFNWGDYAEWSSWRDAEDVFDETYEVLAGFGKPVMFAEIGTSQTPGDADAWVAEALEWFATLPELGAIVWFDRTYDGTIDFRLTRDQQAGSAAVLRSEPYAPDLRLEVHPVPQDAPEPGIAD